VRHRSATTAAPVRMRDLIDAVRAFDGAAFRFGLEATEARLEPLEFLEQHIQPLMVAVGKAWAKGGLDIRHEHFASSHVADVLRDLRHRLQRQDSGPTVAIASFPDDRHEIGPLMASVVFADAGWNVVYLGADTPASQLTALAKDASLEAVAVGVSSTAPKSTARALRTLAAELPDFTRLVVGGTGVPNRLPGVVRFPDLARLRRWAVEVDTRQQRGAPRNLRRRSPKRS
jgi:methanogenic corrinoid protein MtbC1